MREVSAAVRQKYSEEREQLQKQLANKLKQAMATLVGNSSHADLILVANDGQKIPAHSSIIRTRAPGFYKKYIANAVGSRASSPRKSQSPSTPKSRTNSKSPSNSRSGKVSNSGGGGCSSVKLADVDFNSLRFFLRSIYTEDEIAADPGSLRVNDRKQSSHDEDNDENDDKDDSGSSSDRSGGRKDKVKRGNEKGSNQKTYSIDGSPTKKTRRNDKGGVDEVVEQNQSMHTSTGSEIDIENADNNDNNTQMSSSSELVNENASRNQSPLKEIQGDTSISDVDIMQTSLQDTDLEDSTSIPLGNMTSFRQIAMESPTKELRVPPLMVRSDEPHIYDDVKNDRLIITQTVVDNSRQLPTVLSDSYPKLPPAILSPEMSPTSKEASLHSTYTRDDFGGDMTSSLVEETPVRRHEDQLIAKFIHFNDLGSPADNLQKDAAFESTADAVTKPMFPMFVEFNQEKPVVFPNSKLTDDSENLPDDFAFTPMFSRRRHPSVSSLRSMDSADFALSPMQEQQRGLGHIEPFPAQDTAACSMLADDLLQMYMTQTGADVTIKTSSDDIVAHKCILSATCAYFESKLSDPSIDTLDLNNNSYSCVDFCMQFLYGGVTCLPEDLSVWELVSLANKLNLEGLMSVARLHIQAKFCHFFHKPCGTCVASTLDIIASLESSGLDDILNKCLQWQAKHFCRIWKTRAFAQLPDSVHNLCYNAVLGSLSPVTVLDVILGCEKLQATLPRNARVGAAESVAQLVTCLMDTSVEFIAANLDHVITTDTFLSQGKGLGLNVGLLEDLIPGVVHSLAPDTGCRVLVRLYELLVFLSGQGLHRNLGSTGQTMPHVESEWNKRFTNLVRRLYEMCDNHLIHHAAAVVKCNSWSLLTPSMQNRIKETGIFVELRQPRAPPPKLSSLNRTYKRSSSSGARYVPSPSRDRSQSSQRKTSVGTPNGALMEEAENIHSPRTFTPDRESAAPSATQIFKQDVPTSNEQIPDSESSKSVDPKPNIPSAAVSRPASGDAASADRAVKLQKRTGSDSSGSRLPQPNATKEKQKEVPSPTPPTPEASKQHRKSRDSKSNGTFIKSPKNKPAEKNKPSEKMSNSPTFENLQQQQSPQDTPKAETDRRTAETGSKPVEKKKVVRQLTQEIKSPVTEKADSQQKKINEKEPVPMVTKNVRPVPMATVKPTISGQTVDRNKPNTVTTTVAVTSNTVVTPTANAASTKGSGKSEKKPTGSTVSNSTVARPNTINVQRIANRKTTSTNDAKTIKTKSNTSNLNKK